MTITGRSACRAAAIGLVAALAVSCPAGADDFQVYSNQRFGTTVDVPRSWPSEPPPENGDGLVFRAKDGAASITVSGMLNIDETPALAMANEARPQNDERVTYRQIGSRSVTVSGTKGNTVFYRKSLLVCRDQIWNHMSIEYPVARKREFDTLVARVARSLHFSGRSEQIPTCR